MFKYMQMFVCEWMCVHMCVHGGCYHHGLPYVPGADDTGLDNIQEKKVKRRLRGGKETCWSTGEVLEVVV